MPLPTTTTSYESEGEEAEEVDDVVGGLSSVFVVVEKSVVPTLLLVIVLFKCVEMGEKAWANTRQVNARSRRLRVHTTFIFVVSLDGLLECERWSV